MAKQYVRRHLGHLSESWSAPGDPILEMSGARVVTPAALQHLIISHVINIIIKLLLLMNCGFPWSRVSEWVEFNAPPDMEQNEQYTNTGHCFNRLDTLNAIKIVKELKK